MPEAVNEVTGKPIPDSILVPWGKVGTHFDYKAASSEFQEAMSVAKDKTVDLSKLIPSEFFVKKSRIQLIIKNFDPNLLTKSPAGNTMPSRVVKYKGNLYIHDGHHRLSSLKLMGKKSAVVRFIDMDNK